MNMKKILEAVFELFEMFFEVKKPSDKQFKTVSKHSAGPN